MSEGHVQITTTPSRIDGYCSVCDTGVDAPNKGLGRAVVAAWLSRHQHSEEKR